ncbi:mediator of RNA polymerase II transcription subunit 1-like isoform X2 [Parambassis ranga]|uniref:Mediator of RNA polymerase II transcription subunit 1 n=1 Tax=Parambassis ranga TaxID=210632 RepID=A0A6P7KP03_9TELE|nr:mediator of RNA polymerase II transcription subunit 1-like isoform X2 [Parambassis ranga]
MLNCLQMRTDDQNDQTPMKGKAIISELRVKFAEKNWNETFQLVRRCMEKSRDESKPCEPLVRSLERLQEEFNVSSMNATKSRLETIAKQQGMGFHINEATCYLTADLFYVEVLLLPCGAVQEVKVASHGESPAPSESLLQLLRSKHFADFSVKLGGLFAQYNIPGDNEIKLKLLASLQYLGKDLQQLSLFPREPKFCDPQVDMINNGRVGHLIAGKEDSPLTVQFYVPPTDGAETLDSHLDPVIQAAQVTVGVSDMTHKLQMASVILQPPQLDPQGHPVFVPASEASNEALPACFLLRLQPAITMVTSLFQKLSQITDVAVPSVDLQWAPLPKLLMRGSPSANSHCETLDNDETLVRVPLPGGETHTYILPRGAWDVPAHRAAVLDSVPFTQPAHVPALLELLRHQCAINTLLSSCVTAQFASPGSVCDMHFEVRPESDTSFSVTFLRPDTDSLAVLLVNVLNPHQITCSLFGATSDPSMDEYISSVITRCMSVPETMRTLYSRLKQITSVPLCAGHRATTEAENDGSAPSSAAVMDNNRGPAAFCQTAAVPEDGFGVSASAVSAAKSELLPEINASTSANPYTFAPGAVFPHCVGTNGQMSVNL